jgi:hypothetical protein
MEEYARVWNSHSGQWSKCFHIPQDEIRKDREARRKHKLKLWDRDIKKAKAFDGISGIQLIEIIIKQNKRSKKFNQALKDLMEG